MAGTNALLKKSCTVALMNAGCGNKVTGIVGSSCPKVKENLSEVPFLDWSTARACIGLFNVGQVLFSGAFCGEANGGGFDHAAQVLQIA